MTIRELSKCIVSEMQITFDEDPTGGTIDVIIPVTSNAEDILGDAVLDLEVHLMRAVGGVLIVSTCTR